MSGRDHVIDLTALGASPPSGSDFAVLVVCALGNLGLRQVLLELVDGASLLVPNAITLACLGYCLVTVWTRSARSLRACEWILWGMFGWMSIQVLASGTYDNLRDVASTMLSTAVILGLLIAGPAWIVGSVATRVGDAVVEERELFGGRAPAWGFQLPLATLRAVAWSPAALGVMAIGLGACGLVFVGGAEKDVDGRAMAMSLLVLSGFSWKFAKWVAGWTDLRRWLPRPASRTLYLRSQLDDGLEGEKLRIYGLRVPVGGAEEPIVNALSRFGLPLAVSVGRRVPTGCVRIGPFPGEAWQAVVREEIRRAEAVACVLGITEGIEWEIRELLATRPARRTVFLLPPTLDRRHTQAVPPKLRVLSLLAHLEEVTGDTQPVPPDPESLVGCVVGLDGLVWVRATPETFGGYDRVVTVMIQLSRVGVSAR